MTDEELIEQLAKALSQAEEWPLWEPWRTRARLVLPLFREAELRGVKAGLETAWNLGDEAGWPDYCLAAIDGIDPATVAKAPTPNP